MYCDVVRLSHFCSIAARFSRNHSECGEAPRTRTFFNSFVDFLLQHYLEILGNHSLDIVYVGGADIPAPTTGLLYKPGVAPTDEQIMSWTEEIHQENFYDFDEIISLSEQGINSMFSSMWSEASRRGTDEFLFEARLDNFTGTFDHPTVRLMSSGRAIVWLTAKNGELVVKKYVHPLLMLMPRSYPRLMGNP